MLKDKSCLGIKKSLRCAINSAPNVLTFSILTNVSTAFTPELESLSKIVFVTSSKSEAENVADLVKGSSNDQLIHFTPKGEGHPWLKSVMEIHS